MTVDRTPDHEIQPLTKASANLAGTNGRDTPVNVSYTMVAPDISVGIALRLREDSEDCSVRSSGTSC